MIKIKAAIYEKVFKKKYLDKQKCRCNENIRSWLQAMIDNNIDYIERTDGIIKEEMIASVEYAKHLIALSQRNELERIAEIHGSNYQKLNQIYSEQSSWAWESLLKELYTWYPQYYPKLINDYLEDKIKGVIFGQAIGDALGLGAESMSRKEVQKYYPNGLTDYKQIIQDPHRSRREKGDWTDDTDMMLCIALAIIEDKGKVNPLTIAHKFKEWFEDNPLEIGRNTYKVLALGDYVDNPYKAAELVWELSKKNSAANGGIMRTSIIGVFSENVVSLAEDVCRLTHVDPRCIGSCVIISWLIHGLVYKDTLLSKERLQSMADNYDMRISEYLKKSFNGSLEDLELDDDNERGYTLKTLASALWTIFHCNSFEEGLLKVVNAGGDADTNAAVACSLLGAKYGYSKIPRKYIDGLVRKEYLDDIVKQLLGLLGEIH